MPSRGGSRGGNFALENRHPVGLFPMLVVIFGVVFTLGFLPGRNQYDSWLRAAVVEPSETCPSNTGSPLKSKGKAKSEEGASVGYRLVGFSGDPNNFQIRYLNAPFCWALGRT